MLNGVLLVEHFFLILNVFQCLQYFIALIFANNGKLLVNNQFVRLGVKNHSFIFHAFNLKVGLDTNQDRHLKIVYFSKNFFYMLS